MKDLYGHHLRWLIGMWDGRPNVFIGSRRKDSPIVDIKAFVRFGDSRIVTVDITAIVYGRLMPELRGEYALPLSLSRIGGGEFQLESCVLSDDLPRSSYVLSGVPAAVGDDWCSFK